MPLPEQLSDCLYNLTSHCESLLAQNESLRSENKSLRARIDAMSFPMSCLQDSNRLAAELNVHAAQVVVDPPGAVPEHGAEEPPKAFAWSNPAASLAVAFTPVTPEPLQCSCRSEAGAAGARVSGQGEAPGEGTPGKKSVGIVSPRAGVQDDSLAAARLGMLAQGGQDSEDDEDWQPLNGFIDTFQVFSDNVFSTSGRKGSIIETIVHSFVFKAFCIMVIAVNTVWIGVAADHQVKNSFRRIQGLPKEPDWKEPDIAFTVWFALELVLRAATEGKKFFTGSEDCKWNCFDFFLVLNSLVELLLPVTSNFSFLRIFRVFRVVRVVRVVRFIKALKSLRTMVFALLNSFTCLMWAFVMIILIMFVFAIVFGNAVAGHFDTLNLDSPDQQENALLVNKSFGSIYETMVTLFCSITGGNDWMMYGELLRLLQHGELYFLIFAFYIVFCLVGMLNVVTGIFVDSAVCTRTEDEVVECFTEDQRRTSEEVRRIFKEADLDNSGTLSFQELASHLENPWVKAYFSGLDIDPSEAGIIFTLIDTDGSNTVSIDEFVDGTMKLKGHAKSIDVLSMMFDTVRFSMKFNGLCAHIEEELRAIKEVIIPGSAAESKSLTHGVMQLAATNRFLRMAKKVSTSTNKSST